MSNKAKQSIRRFLQVQETTPTAITILQTMTQSAEIIRNKLWYRGDPSELQQFYEQVDDGISNTSFWAARSSNGINMRKLHSGIPALIVDTISDLIVNDLLSITVAGLTSAEDSEQQAVWDEISKENNFPTLLKNAIRTALSEGDGAFKISFDPDVSEYPIIEFYGAERVDYTYNRGRIQGITFLTQYHKDDRTYTLSEYYTKDGIAYSLVDPSGNEVDLSYLPQTQGLQPVINTNKFIMAVPLMFDSNKKYEGRGKSIYDGKFGAFDGLDETISQWVESLRDGRVKTYIPESMIPRNPNTGELLKSNPFDNRFVSIGSDMTEGVKPEIKTVQPDINASVLLETYISFLDISLQGIIAPSTLGIDTKKLDNAEAQREKEKATLYTRNRIINTLQDVLPKLVDIVLKTYDTLQEATTNDYDVSVEFGEYANPSFEAQVETVGKAVSLGIMSIDTAVNELYGDTWTDEEKAAEIERLKAEASTEMSEPSVGDVVE